MAQPTKRKPPRRKPPPKPADTEKVKKFAEKLQVELNHHFGVINARMEPRKLWSVEGVDRYRINWWDWDQNTIKKTAFVHITVTGLKEFTDEQDNALKIEIKEITT